MNSDSNQRIFQLKLDPLTGNSEWIVVDEYDQFPDRPSNVDLSATSYLDMLNDSWRNRAYRVAIDKTVNRPCHVLDIGAGTGLLSMMAARAMGLDDKKTAGDYGGRVTACESYLPMVKLMRKVLRCNGMERKITLINKRSDELKVGTDISTRADILVSEILDSELLGEGLIPTLQHAHDELLVENPQCVPYRATVYSQLVESTFLGGRHDPCNNEMGVSDRICLFPTEVFSNSPVKPQQYSLHCDSLRDEIKLLSEPVRVFEFNFWKRPDSHGEVELLVKAVDSGRVNAVISWWVLQLDEEGTIFYSTAPKWAKASRADTLGDGNWCDHWKQCIWFISGKGLQVSKGEDVHLHAVHSEISIKYDLKVQSQRTEDGSSCNEDFLLKLSPEKIATYSDGIWRQRMFVAVQNALCQKNSPLSFVVDDSVFLATAIAHLCKTSEIILSFPGLQEKGLQHMQAIARANGFSMDHLKLLNHRKPGKIMDDMHKVDLLVGEPFYYGCDAQLPWKNLRFWKDRTNLGDMLSKDAKTIPCKGNFRACAMFLPDLWRSRCGLENIEGFDHSAANVTLGACSNLPLHQEGPILPFFVWQCGQTKELSENFTLMEFDFTKPISSCSGNAKVKFTKPGICHGLVFWIDWVLDAENSISVSTGPDHRHWKQGVKLLSKPVNVSNQDPSFDEYQFLEIKANFDSSNGDVKIVHTFVQ